MGSPLGCTFADFYMCHLENKVLQNPELRPFTYCRYVDDIFVEARNILISSEDDQYQTTVYRKKTDIGRCLNAASECPKRYKLSVIRAYLRRAFRNCSLDEDLEVTWFLISGLLIWAGRLLD
ncbi:uncharacterized protein LOC143034738 [Oratosquilla oratoria]|uniref:uncharacterized protein LOC143034738 n=1 Tax=Oratosquilla oratoria TaxID=337810 RepID=UPI003F76E5EC